MAKVRVGVFGHTGRLGQPLVKILERHPFSEIVFTETRSEGESGNLKGAECVFLALPYGESEKHLPRLEGKRIIDLSIDHRLSNGWVYGSPEINREAIEGAVRVANPGCYATSIILGLWPLKGKIRRVNIASTSGISGAGLEVAARDNFLVYREGRDHQQIGEIEKILDFNPILFVPQRIDTAERGIVSTMFVYSDIAKGVAGRYYEFFQGKPFVRLASEIETKNVNHTNFCHIKVMEFGGTVIVISALDNLIKGGSGQAIQNFNLMYGFEETVGLM